MENYIFPPNLFSPLDAPNLKWRRNSRPLIYAAIFLVLIRSTDSKMVVTCDGFGKKMCYSCVSDNAKKDWYDFYQQFFAMPKNFSRYCNDLKRAGDKIQLISCQSTCVTVVDPQFILGLRVGENYIRGCLDTIFTSNHMKHTAQKMFQFPPLEIEQCRPVPRSDLFNNAKARSDNVSICACSCDKCNVYPAISVGVNSRAGDNRILFIIMFLCLLSSSYSYFISIGAFS